MDQQREGLDQPRWHELWSRLGAQGGGAATFAQLAAAYAEPTRAYHNAEHIRDCLGQFDLNRHLAQHPDEVEVALWFHDVVYVPGAADNEEQSAQRARAALAAVSREKIDRIPQLILATRHTTLATLPDEQFICDVDLSILGREPEVFDEFERRIRREYAWVPEPIYRRERSAVLSEFLRRPSIYQTEPFRHRYELTARANLKRNIAALGQ
jgi:predicted metal-dependent HD superfamily phosphohydrolase